MKTLITGGAGFIGSHLSSHLMSKGQQVVILDDFSGTKNINLKSNKELDKLTIIKGSILDQGLVLSLMADVNYCFHLAASLGVEKINKDPVGSLETNLRGTEIVLNAAAFSGVSTLLASSSEIYGKNPEMPLTEDSDRVLGSPKIARWSYSEAKAMDELLAFELHKNKSFQVTIARFFNTVGPRQSGSYGMVLPRFVSAAMSHNPLIVYGNGKQSRTFCSVSDVVEALVLLMESKESVGKAFNIGSTDEITMAELAQKVIKLTNSSSEIAYKKHSEVFGDNFEEPHRRLPDISKITKAIGWLPKKSLDEVILEVADNLRANET
jgi:UDP-glucose 4-epimerase